ncbi:MAG: hypothetical protein QW275_02895 [Candidatus Anstonellaceae archaeon]
MTAPHDFSTCLYAQQTFINLFCYFYAGDLGFLQAQIKGGYSMDSGAKQAGVSKLTPLQVRDKIMSYGVSDLDAGLIADCINVGKSTTWMNNDPVAEDINQKLAEFLKEHGFGFEITVTPVKMDKYIWDVRKKQ